MTDLEALNKRCQALRSEGRLEEALLVAREAVRVGPADGNAWWQLALTQKKLGQVAAQEAALERVVQLVPGFAQGWCELGFLFYDSDRPEDAIVSFERALAEDEDHLWALKGLAQALKDREGDDDAKRCLQVLQKLDHLGEASDLELFDLAYLYGAQNDALASAHVYERLENLSSSGIGLMNLGLMYVRLGRDADATDALRLSLTVKPDNPQAVKLLSAVDERRKSARVELRAGRDPYLPQELWYKHYVNPFSLLDVKPEDAKENVKALQRARQSVLREIELEDNQVSWMPGLHIDRSTALSLFESLNDESRFAVHAYVYERKPLEMFLSKGSLSYFGEDKQPADQIRLPHQVERATKELLSQAFAAQYDDLLTLAVENSDTAALQVLLAGRRLVLPEHEEQCFEGASRALLRLCEPLDQMYDKAQDDAVDPAKVTAWVATSKLAAQLSSLPIEFHKVHERVYRNFRGLSIAHYNRTNDPVKALELLELGRTSATKSASMRHQFDLDRETLNEHVAEATKHDVSLTFAGKPFSINRDGVSYSGKHIAAKNVQGIRWGITQISVNPVKLRLQVGFVDGRNDEIDVAWTATGANTEEQQGYWRDIVQACLAYIADYTLAHFKANLGRTNGMQMGDALVRSDGVVFKVKGFIFTKDHFAPWSAISSSIENGEVILRDPSTRNAVAAVPLSTTYNAFLLGSLATRKES